MESQMKHNQMIALTFATQASFIAVWVFILCRGDHDMKLVALGGVIGQVSALMSTASTMLKSSDSARPTDPSELPPGSVASTQVQTPPVTLDPSSGPAHQE